jgi:hypothetical protein
MWQPEKSSTQPNQQPSEYTSSVKHSAWNPNKTPIQPRKLQPLQPAKGWAEDYSDPTTQTLRMVAAVPSWGGWKEQDDTSSVQN